MAREYYGQFAAAREVARLAELMGVPRTKLAGFATRAGLAVSRKLEEE